MVIIKLRLSSFQFFHDIAGGISTALPSNLANDNKAFRPTPLERRGIIVGVVLAAFFDSFVNRQIRQMETKQDGMIMGAEGLRAILTRHEKANFIIREILAYTLHQKLEVTLIKS